MQIEIGWNDRLKTNESVSSLENELQLDTLVSKISVFIILSQTKIKKAAMSIEMKYCFLKIKVDTSCIIIIGKNISTIACFINTSLKEQSIQPDDNSFAYSPIAI